jgi:hypothetical protein
MHVGFNTGRHKNPGVTDFSTRKGKRGQQSGWPDLKVRGYWNPGQQRCGEPWLLMFADLLTR